MDQLASKVIHGRSTEKYTSINVKNGYIEFRSPGGDWLNDNFKEIDNTLRRFTVALSAAVDPKAYREEYLKKLYKLLDVSGEKDPLSYFAKFAAGELPRAALKSFVRQARLEREVKRGETGNQKMWWSVTNPSQSYAGVEVVATTREEAIEKALGADGYPSWANTRQSIVAKPLRPYEEKPGQSPPGDVTPFEIYNRLSDAVLSTVLARNAQEAQAELEQFRAEQMQAQGLTVAQATATYGIRHATGEPAARPQGVDTRVDYELYSRASGAVIDTFPARNDDEAITRLSDYINFGAGQSNPDNFDVRRAGRAPIPGSTLDLQRQRAAASAAATQMPTIDIDLEPAPAPQQTGMGQWNGQWKVLVGGQEVYRFGGVGNSQADANRIAAAWLRQNGQGVSGEGFEVYPVMDESLREYKMPQPSQGPGRYRDLNEPLGPESPPKMPSGTVKVDVSDTQDWYQLGQDISNLAIANKAHYNQGPPHTVLAFGSEDLEHMYIRQLKRLGLNTHDLDEPGEDDLDEGVKSALATAALAGTMAMGAQAKAPDMVQQIVEPGDTVYSIARQTGADPKEIYRLNKMDRNTKLEVGQRVIVPDYSKPVSKMPATATPTVKPPVVQAAPPTPSLKDKISSIIPKFSSDNKEEQGVTLLSDNTDAEAALQTAAKAAGLTGVELAQFMAQTRHESWDFGKMKEVGNKKQFAKYDAPRKAKQLGNKVRGDGERFKGRGFIQLTGRDNYTRASQQIFGDDRLVKNPDLASRLDVGAQIALWFWKNQVRPNVSNFNNTKEVTNAINPGLSGLQDRHTKFKEYLAVL
jgi:putative chitinase